ARNRRHHKGRSSRVARPRAGRHRLEPGPPLLAFSAEETGVSGRGMGLSKAFAGAQGNERTGGARAAAGDQQAHPPGRTLTRTRNRKELSEIAETIGTFAHRRPALRLFAGPG